MSTVTKAVLVMNLPCLESRFPCSVIFLLVGFLVELFLLHQKYFCNSHCSLLLQCWKVLVWNLPQQHSRTNATRDIAAMLPRNAEKNPFIHQNTLLRFKRFHFVMIFVQWEGLVLSCLIMKKQQIISKVTAWFSVKFRKKKQLKLEFIHSSTA